MGDTCERLADEAPTQDEVIHLLGQLHACDVLQCDVPPHTAELLERFERQQQRKLQQQLFSVFSWRLLPLDPGSVPDRHGQVRPAAARRDWRILWLALWSARHRARRDELDAAHPDMVARALTAQNVALIWLIFPSSRRCTSSGTPITRAFGGEVHDMGVMLLVITPVPYVDASACLGVSEPWHRRWSAARRHVVEVSIASVARSRGRRRPGVVRLIAENTILIAGISTVLFNANPLLRFDGYHILMDFPEIPNLRPRATMY